MAAHTGLELEKNDTEIIKEGIHVRNVKPMYLLPGQQMETQLLVRFRIDKSKGWPKTVLNKGWTIHFSNVPYQKT